LVSIKWKGNKYFLESKNDSGYYHYTGNELQILEGETYEIEFDYFGNTTKGSTTIPPKPKGLELDQDTLKIYFFDFLDSILSGDSIDFPEPHPILASWDNKGNNYHYIVIENIEENPEEVYPDTLGIIGAIDFFVFSEPLQEDEWYINDFEISHLGTHKIKLYRINQEYVDLFSSFDQDSRTLNEPLTNLENGLGVFAGFNSIESTFEAVIEL